MGAIPQTVELSSGVFTDGLNKVQRFELAKQNPEALIESVYRLAIEGISPRKIAKIKGFPKFAFIRWVEEECAGDHESALRAVADELAHSLIDIADTSDPDQAAKTKLRIEVRRWLASKWNKMRYGEHTKVEHTGSVNLIALLGSLPNSHVVEEKVIPALPETVEEVTYI